jgi:hypothetical protein
MLQLGMNLNDVIFSSLSSVLTFFSSLSCCSISLILFERYEISSWIRKSVLFLGIWMQPTRGAHTALWRSKIKSDVGALFQSKSDLSLMAVSFHISSTPSGRYARIVSNNDKWDYLVVE